MWQGLKYHVFAWDSVACSGASLIKSELCQCVQIRKWLTLEGIFWDHQVQSLLKQGHLEQVGQDSVHLDFVNISRSQNWFQDRYCCEFWYGDRASLWEHNSCGEKILKSQVVQISSVAVTKKNQNNNPTQPHTKKKKPLKKETMPPKADNQKYPRTKHKQNPPNQPNNTPPEYIHHFFVKRAWERIAFPPNCTTVKSLLFYFFQFVFKHVYPLLWYIDRMQMLLLWLLQVVCICTVSMNCNHELLCVTFKINKFRKHLEEFGMFFLIC